METNQDNKNNGVATTAHQTSIGRSIVIASIVIVVGFLLLQLLEQKAEEDRSIREHVYQQTESTPFESCLRKAKNEHEAEISFARAVARADIDNCASGVWCEGTTEQIMASMQRSIEEFNKQFAEAEQRCINLYKWVKHSITVILNQ